MSKSTARIIQNSVQVFRQKGFNGSSVNDIATASGLLKGSLYSHFASKEEILLEVISEVEKKFFQAIGFVDGTVPPPELDAVLEKTAGFFIQHESCLMANLLSESLPDAPKQRLIDFFLKWKDLLKTVMRPQIAERDKEKFAQNIISQFEGNVLMMKVISSPKPVKDCLQKLKLEYTQLA